MIKVWLTLQLEADRIEQPTPGQIHACPASQVDLVQVDLVAAIFLQDHASRNVPSVKASQMQN